MSVDIRDGTAGTTQMSVDIRDGTAGTTQLQACNRADTPGTSQLKACKRGRHGRDIAMVGPPAIGCRPALGCRQTRLLGPMSARARFWGKNESGGRDAASRSHTIRALGLRGGTPYLLRPTLEWARVRTSSPLAERECGTASLPCPLFPALMPRVEFFATSNPAYAVVDAAEVAGTLKHR